MRPLWIGKRFVVLWLCLLISLFSQVIWARAEPISMPAVELAVGGELFRHPLAGHLEVLIDQSKSLGLGELRNEPYSTSFSPFPKEGIWKQSPSGAFWLRFQIKNDQNGSDTVAIGPFRSELAVELYHWTEGQEPQKKALGPSQHFKDREVQWKEPWILVPLQARETRTVYLRYEAPEGGFLKINPTITTAHSMIISEGPRQLNWFFGNGIYAGIMFAMTLYNLFVYLSIRDRSYLFYVASISTFGVVVLAAEEIGVRYFWPFRPGFSQEAQTWLGMISGSAGLLFVRSFLDTKSNTPKLDKMLIGGIGVYGAALGLQLLGAKLAAGILFGACGLVMGLSVLVAGVACVKRGWRPARYFLIAWILMIVGVWVSQPFYIGLMEPNGWIENAWKIGSAAEVTLLSFALADRIGLLREENEKAQKALVESQARELQASQQAGRDLEALVHERLAELSERNKELARSREELSHARDEAMVASRAKSVFLANMSHELRTPLNAIIGYSELLLEELADPRNEMSNDLRKIRGAGKHLLSLIDSILDISKIEAGRMDLSFGEMDLRIFLLEIRDTVHPLLEKNHNHFELIIQPDAGKIFTDAARLRQVLLNLLGNAAKFTENGQITLSVKRENKGDQDWIVMAVSDTGIGIPPDQIGHLFMEYSQASRSVAKKFGGTGLGLAISRRICRLLGGDLWASSEGIPGKGTVFTLRIPARPKRPEPPMADEDKESGLPSRRA